MAEKLLLFDIDGTLLSTRGVPRKAMYQALVARYGNFNYDDNFNFSGRTDWEIVEHLLRFAQVEQKITKVLIHEILNNFVFELKKVLHDGFQPLVYPGIRELLSHLVSRENIVLGLVTGNVKEGARLKLTCARLNDYFSIGGFGDDSNNRNDLPPLAIRRACQHYNKSYHKNDILIIGDSVHDITCAKVNGLRSLAVATGWTPYSELQEASPDFLIKDFSDINKSLSILLGCS